MSVIVAQCLLAAIAFYVIAFVATLVQTKSLQVASAWAFVVVVATAVMIAATIGAIAGLVWLITKAMS
jgi:hypothetical protein